LIDPKTKSKFHGIDFSLINTIVPTLQIIHRFGKEVPLKFLELS
jgi:hypothetical protein